MTPGRSPAARADVARGIVLDVAYGGNVLTTKQTRFCLGAESKS